MASGHVQIFLHRASDFFEGMRQLSSGSSTRNAAALLAIHSALSYADALRTALGEEKLTAEDHSTAAVALQKLLVKRGAADEKGIRHLRSLLSQKSIVSYSGKRLNNDDLEQLRMHAERFATWTEQVARRMKLEGWTNEQ